MTTATATQPRYLEEAGVLYRRDPRLNRVQPGESVHFYKWTHFPSETEGESYVVMPYAPATARRLLARLVLQWNQADPRRWGYSIP
jgi:hypothetical protein